MAILQKLIFAAMIIALVVRFIPREFYATLLWSKRNNETL